jgi:hypothetical protein
MTGTDAVSINFIEVRLFFMKQESCSDNRRISFK